MKYYAIFLQKENEQYVRFGEKKFKPNDLLISFHERSFFIDLKMIGYEGNNCKLYFYDYDTQKQETKDKITAYTGFLTFNTIKTYMNAKDIDIIVKQQIFKQLAAGLLQGLKTNWILIIFALIGGLGIGYIVCSAVNPSHTIIEHILPNGTIVQQQINFVLSLLRGN